MKIKLIITEDYCMKCHGYPRSLYPNGRGTRPWRTIQCIAARPDINGADYHMLDFLDDGPYCIYCLAEQLYHEGKNH